MSISGKIAGSLVTLLLAGAAAPACAGPLSLGKFRDATGIQNLSEEKVSALWRAMSAMGTTKFLGGNLGPLRLDESAMVAGAATLGASEFDNFLRTGSLGASVSGLGGTLSQRMTAGAGADLAYLVGSFTTGGGSPAAAAPSFASMTAMGGATAESGMCDPEIGNKLAEVGETYVNGIVNASMSEEMGFSKMESLTAGAGGKGSGFASLSCLDKLFQGVQGGNLDILFKPPSLGNLTNMLQNWTCGEAVSVAQQVAGAFGGGEIFKTGNLGGFFPTAAMGEAMDGAVLKRPGINQGGASMFGADFASFQAKTESEIRKTANLSSLFK